MLPYPEWKNVSVRDVTLKSRTWSPATEPRTKIKYVDVSAVSREALKITSAADLPASAAPSRARKIIRSGDTIFATIRPTLKRVAQVPEDLDGELASTAFCVLRPDRRQINPDFLFFAVSNDEFVADVTSLETGASYPAVRDSDILDQLIFLPPLAEQSRIAHLLGAVRASLLHQSLSITTAEDLKRSAMRELFTRGLRGEAQKEAEIGLLPERWDVGRLDRYVDVISTRMTYSELEALHPVDGNDAVKVLGIKVADMNRPGNEVELHHSELERTVARAIAEYRCAPPRTIIFPKRGAAIATNKKRISAEWTAFDPNVIGVIGRDRIDQLFLFQWFQNFDLRKITEPGPTPQLNKKNLEPVLIPVPPTLDEQREIAVVLDAIDRKIDLHKKKRVVLEALFKSLLHKLMTGEIRVDRLDLTALSCSHVEAVA